MLYLNLEDMICMQWKKSELYLLREEMLSNLIG